jgi:acyl-CoA synthetase (AMP-forming)/AMP-acid ligase II/acyl carrier protein
MSDRTTADQDRARTLVDLLGSRSRSNPDRVAFRFLDDRQDCTAMTYRELDLSARRIAVGLQARFEPGTSAVIVFPPGLGFVKAFFGCAYAGILPVPATYPKPRRPSARLSAIVGDARPVAILTTQRVLETLHDTAISGSADPPIWLSCDELETSSADRWREPEAEPGDIAFLQYTSGSTRDPRGVEVSHENIAQNLEMIRQGFGLSRDTAQVGVSWLPAYHDMGLIGGILESIYVGGTTTLLSPLSFLRRPTRWLRAISDYGAVVSGGPNFAYELCLRKFDPAEMEGLDLSSWRVAFSGAEPIRSSTLRRFAEVFGRYGFSDSAFYPCYGLAEATLLVTGGQGPDKLATCSLQASQLQEHGRAVPQVDGGESTIELVDCGRPLLDEQVLIVDPESRLPCDENIVGEIWIRGRNVARGYRNHSPENEATFNGRLANSNNGTFLKSGDLGFMREGSLFVTGRLKELLIIRGRNYYPNDLEATVQDAHEKLIPGGGAAFLVDQHGDEILVLVQEIDRATKAPQREEIIRDIRRNVTVEHDVFVHEVILIRMGTMPRTTSGKVRYADVKRQYLDGELVVMSRWSFAQQRVQPQRPDASVGQGHVGDLKQLRELAKIDDAEARTAEIQTRLMAWLSQAAGAADGELGPHRPFADYGLDSLAAVELIGQLEDGLGLRLSPSIAWTYPTPAALAAHLSELISGGNGAAAGSQPAAEPADDTFDRLLSQLEQMPEEQVTAMLAEERPENHS